ncbi:hypothetical protein BO83DRAFT_398505 [Aspergillus eucalypticola CBS 122712]|uniref:Peptidase S8/S53 domain-containing protein n=1 Tax=Aspergillus eucalypticola (strain CBS 122712 / IBT 29274) TaxID=1448314 RepID=A0A317VMJ8_ASPEC|nr:uncharacterized protein BO83DRAFT_398505 [Aspergillus eucalypticola CBS 122712]PWY74072.1 hypothetical protein BO83DRAFT_398505 [Aspergillus eucalypticola CBS 122712]
MSLGFDDELWLSDQTEEEECGFTDPRSFSLELTYQGPVGDFRTRNKPGQLQRPMVSCQAKAMIHGRWGGGDQDSCDWATLLVNEFQFHSYRGCRLKAADIRFRFEPIPGQLNELSVAEIQPNRVFKVARTEQSEQSTTGLELTLGSQPLAGAVNTSIAVSNSNNVEKVTVHHTVVTGDRPADIYGSQHEAHFSLSENVSQQDGIPTRLRACILLKRGTEDDFACVPYIHVTPDFKTWVGQLFSSRDRDDPIRFRPSEPAFDQLEKGIVVDAENLGATNLDRLWGCTMYTTCNDVVDSFVSLSSPAMDSFELDATSDDATYKRLSWEERMKDLTGQLTNGGIWEEMESTVSGFRDYDNRDVPTILHHLSKDKFAHGFYDLPESTRDCILDSLLRVHLEEQSATADHVQANTIGKDKHPYPILTIALEHSNTGFLNTIAARFQHHLPHLLKISHTGDGRNPLHEAFSIFFRWQKNVGRFKDYSYRQEKRTELGMLTLIIQKWVELAPDSAIAAKDVHGNTPLHYAMHYNLCYYLNSKVYRPVVVALIDRSLCRRMQAEDQLNGVGKSPYLIYLESEADFAEKKRTSSSWKPDTMKTTSWSKPNRPALGLEGKRAEGKKTGEDTESRKTQDGLFKPPQMPSHSELPTIGKVTVPPHSTPSRTQQNPQCSQDNSKATGPASTPQFPSAMPRSSATKELTPNQIQQDKADDKIRRQAADSIRQYLRTWYIRNMSDADARKLLYGNIASDTLSYVRIPQVLMPDGLPETATISNTTSEKRGIYSASGSKKALRGRISLISVFDELALAGVRQILRLQVEDNGDVMAHSDAAIERAITGSDHRGELTSFDINIELIHDAEPNVKSIHLHWSGGQTVLRGWADAILVLYTQFKELTCVYLHAYQERVIDTRKDEETCTIPSHGDYTNEKQYLWINRLEDFRDAMLEVHKVSPKVALIDDGLDYGDFDVYPHTEVRGFSCYPRTGQTEHPWHKSTNGHRTAMANMILRINPWVHLLVIRIEDGISYANPGSPSRTIQPDSAARAVEAAIKLNVDVISMSWTIRKQFSQLHSSPVDPGSLGKKSIDEVGIERLERAIREAAENNILMVCSAADDIELLGKDNLPFCAAEHNIFRIGSCDSQAQRDPMTENRTTISYFLPGIQVPEAQRPHSLKPIVYHDGSSIATALAAGLISIILHCARWVDQCQEAQEPAQNASSEKNQFQQLAKNLRIHKNMQIALRNIARSHGSDEPEDSKQLPVYRLFADTTNKLNNAKGRQKVERLGDLVRYLCHGIEA